MKNNSLKKEVTVWTLQMGDFSDYMHKVINSYEKTHPNVAIKWVDVPFSEGEKRTLAAVMTDNPPDLINLNPDFSALLAQKGTLEEIPLINTASFNQEIINVLMHNDKLYSIPWYATSAITIYNKNIFNKAGFTNEPRTYDELAAIADVIKTKTRTYAYLPTITENDTMVKILNKYGVANPLDFNSKESIKVFKMFKTLYDKDLIPPETITFLYGFHSQLFTSLKCSLKISSIFPDIKSTILDVLSSDDVTNFDEFIEKLISVIVSLCS